MINYPDKYKHIGEYACETIKNNFTWDKVCEEMIKVYEDKINTNK